MEAAEISEEADNLWWIVPRTKPKNARHAEVKRSDFSADLLNAYLKVRGIVF